MYVRSLDSAQAVHKIVSLCETALLLGHCSEHAPLNAVIVKDKKSAHVGPSLPHGCQPPSMELWIEGVQQGESMQTKAYHGSRSRTDAGLSTSRIAL